MTFAQDPASAEFDGMPRSAIDSGCVDFVLPPKEIAKELHRIRRHPYVHQDERGAQEQGKEQADSVSTPAREEDFLTILDQLRKSSGWRPSSGTGRVPAGLHLEQKELAAK